MIEIRLADERDFGQLAEMKWLHGAEDDIDYGEHNLDGVDKAAFVTQFVEFLQSDSHHPYYQIFVAVDGGVIASAMFVCEIPKIPKPNGRARSLAYLTNVFTRAEYRNRGIGTRLLAHIKHTLTERQCELVFAWPSDNSVNWYERNGFLSDSEMRQCVLTGESFLSSWKGDQYEENREI